MSIETASAILYTYGKERRGSHNLITALVTRIEREQDNNLSGELLSQIVVSLNLVGRTKTKAFRKFRGMALLKKEELSEYEHVIVEDAAQRI